MPIKIERKRVFSGYDGKVCKVDPKLMTDGKTEVLTWSMLLLTGCDVFFDQFAAVRSSGSEEFGSAKKLSVCDRFENGIRFHVTPITTYYSKYHGKWLYIGCQEEFENDKFSRSIGNVSVTSPMMAVYDPAAGDIAGEFSQIPLPFECIGACPHGQIIEYENGELLLSFYISSEERPFGSAVTIRYAYDGGRLRIVKAGTPIYGDDVYIPNKSRGYLEPSAASLRGRYYITLRNDETGYFAESEDGLNFTVPKPWVWDDGSSVGNFNTMQRWIRFKENLYLAYTRRDKLNGHVFRSRAPMYMTRFDEKRGCLIREEEIILVPELGARLGNFSVTDISPMEAVLTTAEWMQPEGCEKYGSDNSIWVVRIREE